MHHNFSHYVALWTKRVMHDATEISSVIKTYGSLRISNRAAGIGSWKLSSCWISSNPPRSWRTVRKRSSNSTPCPGARRGTADKGCTLQSQKRSAKDKPWQQNSLPSSWPRHASQGPSRPSPTRRVSAGKALDSA